MKRSFNYISIGILFLGIALPVRALGPLDLMDRYSGPRPMAMGGAYTAVADDASAPYWNPAGLVDARGNEFSSSYMNLFGLGDRLSFDGLYKLDRSSLTLAANVVQESITGIPKVADVGGGGIIVDHFEEYKRAFNLGVAYRLQPEMSLGTNVRLLYQSLDTDHAFGGSLDAGFLWRLTPQVAVGATARNIVSQLEWTTGTKEYLDHSLTLGSAYRTRLWSIPTLFAVDYEMHQYFGGRWYAGSELWLAPDIFAFRIGTNSLERWTFGFGLRYFGFVCDVCYWKQEYFNEQYLLSIGYVLGGGTAVKADTEEQKIEAGVIEYTEEIASGDPLIVRITDKKHMYDRAAVGFSETNVKTMKRVKDKFTLRYEFDTPPPIDQEQEAKVYLQKKDGTVYTETIKYTVRNKAQ